MQHVSGDEPGHPEARRAMREHLEPKLRGAPGQRRTHASGEPRDGGGGSGDRTLRGRARVASALAALFKSAIRACRERKNQKRKASARGKLTFAVRRQLS